MPDNNAALDRFRRRNRPKVDQRGDALVEQSPAPAPAPAPAPKPMQPELPDVDLVETAERRQFRLEVTISHQLDELINRQPRNARITAETLFEEMLVVCQNDPALMAKVLEGAANRRKKRVRSGRKRRIQKEMDDID